MFLGNLQVDIVKGLKGSVEEIEILRPQLGLGRRVLADWRAVMAEPSSRSFWLILVQRP